MIRKILKSLENLFLLLRAKFRLAPRRAWYAVAAVLLVAVGGVWLARRGFNPGLATNDVLSVLRSAFTRQVPFPGHQSDGGFVFCDFENPGQIRMWKGMNAEILSGSAAGQGGTRAGRIVFHPGQNFASVVVADIMKTTAGVYDWSAYEAFEMRLMNPSEKDETVTILFTDLWTRHYKVQVVLKPREWNTVTIPLKNLRLEIFSEKINEFSVSIRDFETDKDFYIDDVRLRPTREQAARAVRTVKSGAGPAVNPLDYRFADRKEAWTVRDPASGVEVLRTPFMVKNESPAVCVMCPVEGGLPLPPGEVDSPGKMRLRNAQNEEVGFQPRVLSRWPDGSVKWLGLSFMTTLEPGQSNGYFLEAAPSVTPASFESPLSVTEDPTGITVITGPLKVVLSRASFSFLKKVLVDANADGKFSDEEAVTSLASLTMRVSGSEYRAEYDKKDYQISVEEKGGQRAVVRASSWFVNEKGERLCQNVVRYYFYAGKAGFKVSHTWIYTGDPARDTVESYGIRIPFQTHPDARRVRVGVWDQLPMEFTGANAIRLSQLDWETAAVKSAETDLGRENIYQGWFDVSDDARGILVAVRNFRENFPKALSLDPAAKELQIDLWPAEAGAMNLSSRQAGSEPGPPDGGSAFGLAKTHEIWIEPHSGSAPLATLAARALSFEKRLILRTNPYWIDATGAVGRLMPVDRRYADQEKWLERLFDWADRHPKIFSWYGMLNFGDTLTWWRDRDAQKEYGEFGWHPEGEWGWYNCDGPGLHTGALLAFLRSGRWKYFEFGENHARHVMDVDTVHATNEASMAGAMHRRHMPHWAGTSETPADTSVWGLLLYYYLTGDERAFDVAKEAGEFLLKGNFATRANPGVAAQQALANALWGDVLLYHATLDERYLKAAHQLIDIFLKGQQEDGSFLEFYHPKTGEWSGEKQEVPMAWYDLGAFINYHELTQDEAVRDMLLKLVRYLGPREYGGPASLHGMAYAYLITGDVLYIRGLESHLGELMRSQQASSDPIFDGLIYNKPIYHRPNIFLATVPYAFGALEEDFLRNKRT